MKSIFLLGAIVVLTSCGSLSPQEKMKRMSEADLRRERDYNICAFMSPSDPRFMSEVRRRGIDCRRIVVAAGDRDPGPNYYPSLTRDRPLPPAPVATRPQPERTAPVAEPPKRPQLLLARVFETPCAAIALKWNCARATAMRDSPSLD